MTNWLHKINAKKTDQQKNKNTTQIAYSLAKYFSATQIPGTVKSIITLSLSILMTTFQVNMG